MSDFNLRALVGDGSAVRTPVAGSVVGKLAFDQSPNSGPRKQAQRKYDLLCEIMEPGKRSGGFGQPDAPHRILYSGACAIGQRATQGENAEPGAATVDFAEWEVAVPADVRNVSLKSRIASPGWFNEWQANRAYAISKTDKGIVGERVIPTTLDTGSGRWFEVVKEGVSGSVEPNWPNQEFATVSDGSVIWRCMGVVTFYNVIGIADNFSNATETVIRCKVVE